MPLNGVDTLTALLRARAEQSPAAPALAEEGPAASHTETWRSFLERSNRLAAFLAAHGLRPGDRVLLRLRNSIDWEIVQHAAWAARASVVAVDPRDPPDRWARALESLRPRGAFIDAPPPGGPPPGFWFDVAGHVDPGPGAPCYRWSDLPTATPAPAELPRPSDEAVVVFTSGTTGEPKALAYTQEQLLLAAGAIRDAFPEIPDGQGRTACWLPLANLFQRVMNLAAMTAGLPIHLLAEPTGVVAALPRIRPEFLIGVPRFFEKVRREILSRAAERRFLGGVLRRYLSDPRPLPFPWNAAVDRLVFRRVRALFGGRARFLLSGSAPLRPETARFFEAIGLPLLEAYGVSENVVPLALNTLRFRRSGTVGRPLAPNEVRISPEGEVEVRGPGQAAGYLSGAGAPSRTSDGFWRTGDLGRFDGDGYLTLLGRKDDVFKTAGGRSVSPAPIEERMRRWPGVDDAVVLGHGRRRPVAILTRPDDAAPPDERARRALAEASRESLIDIPPHERPGVLLLLARPLSAQRGELTPNLKVRRGVLEARWKLLWDAIERHTEGRDGDAWAWTRGDGRAVLWPPAGDACDISF